MKRGFMKSQFVFCLIFFLFSDNFNILTSKIIFKKFILIYFLIKKTLQNSKYNHYHIPKHPFNLLVHHSFMISIGYPSSFFFSCLNVYLHFPVTLGCFKLLNALAGIIN